MQSQPEVVTSPVIMFALTAEEMATNRIAKLYADIPAGEMPRALHEITLVRVPHPAVMITRSQWARATVRKRK
ncbi:MAG: hypothetical protein U1F87_11310 [Kiritimatiellia bacterium]